MCEYHDYEIINKYRNIFSELSKIEQSRCGCVYEMYQRNLSTAIDGYLSELTQEDKRKVIQLARAEFDYISPEEITEAIRQNQEDGYCSHGLDPNCCPLGCGDI
ncbi:CcgAII protein [Salmonella enterica]|nr:CcgAII protein [Salmonella enterica]EHV2061067.1 CcgAII protein [Salmonella enterica]